MKCIKSNGELGAMKRTSLFVKENEMQKRGEGGKILKLRASIQESIGTTSLPVKESVKKIIFLDLKKSRNAGTETNQPGKRSSKLGGRRANQKKHRRTNRILIKNK